MSNAGPAVVTVTSTTGPGQALTAAKFTDVTEVIYNFMNNTIKIVHQGSGGTTYVDYSAMATVTHTIANGISTVTISS